MHVLLPPSEGKAAGGEGDPLQLEALSWPMLTSVRQEVILALAALARGPEAARVLGLGPTQQELVATNATLATSPTMRAGERYTGVLYDALAYPTLDEAARSWADSHVWVCSAAWGLVSPADMIPQYKLSMKARLEGVGALGARWRPPLSSIITSLEAPVLDLRSQEYQQAGTSEGVIRARVLAEVERGGVRTRVVVSHHNKAAKGRLVRALASRQARTLEDVSEAAESCGLSAELQGQTLEILERHP